MKNSILVAFTVCLAAVATQLSCTRLQPKTASLRGGMVGRERDVVRERVRASDLMQLPISSAEGENLGKVQDLVVNPKTGRIEAALVSKGFMIGKGSVMGLGEIVTTVPWQAINVFSQRQFVLSVDQQKIEGRSGKGRSGRDEPGYDVHIFGFFQPQSAEGVGGSGESNVESGQGEGRSDLWERATPRPSLDEL